VALYQDGQIDQDTAEKLIKETQAIATKGGAGASAKKPKVINIKQTRLPALKFSLGSSRRPTLSLKAPSRKRTRLSLKNYKPAKIKV
jgi:hypothetical protein